MAWIKIFSLEEATGLLKQQYDDAMKRAGRIWNVVSIMCQNARVMKASMGLYRCAMHGQSPLSRGQREMLAVVVSSANQCVY
jgi:hypothetical protein